MSFYLLLKNLSNLVHFLSRSCGWPLSLTAWWARRPCWTYWTPLAGTGRTTSPTRSGWGTLSPAWPLFRTPSGWELARYRLAENIPSSNHFQVFLETCNLCFFRSMKGISFLWNTLSLRSLASSSPPTSEKYNIPTGTSQPVFRIRIQLNPDPKDPQSGSGS